MCVCILLTSVCAPAHSVAGRLVEYRDKSTRRKSDRPAFVVEYPISNGEELETCTYYVTKHPRAYRDARADRFLSHTEVRVMHAPMPVF